MELTAALTENSQPEKNSVLPVTNAQATTPVEPEVKVHKPIEPDPRRPR